jgi:hypothetical protein
MFPGGFQVEGLSIRQSRSDPLRALDKEGLVRELNALLIIVAIIAVILLITGGVGSSLHFLLWIGGILLVLAIIVFLIRALTGRRTL